jgi:hypothetical protein
MECSINIGHFKVNAISNNANINFESTYQNSHTANSTIIGGCFNFGDFCTNSCKQNEDCIPDNEKDR